MPAVNRSDLEFDAGTTWEQVMMGFTPDWLKKKIAGIFQPIAL